MPVLCLGPICIPLNLLLPFMLGLAHKYGLLSWFKRCARTIGSTIDWALCAVVAGCCSLLQDPA